MSVLSKDPQVGWHLDKRISVAHILTTLAMAFALAGWMYAISERVTTNQQKILTHEAVVAVEFVGVQAQLEGVRERDKELMMEWLRQNQEILRRLERIEDSVNRHIEAGASDA